DPDNRRAVDYRQRRRLLSVLDGLTPDEVMARADEGLPKLLVTTVGLWTRRLRPELFDADSSYEPLLSAGAKAACVVAFGRGGGAVTVVPRFLARLTEGWGDTALELPPGEWRNTFTGEIWDEGPVAL